MLDVFLRELIVVRDLDAFLRSIDEERSRVRFRLLQHHDAGRDARAEEEIVRQLDHGIDEIAVDQILANLLLRAAAIHDAGKADNRRRAVRRQPCERVQDESEVGFRRRRKHARRREARIVDEQGIFLACPSNRIRRIGNNRLKRLKRIMLRIGQRVAACDVEIVEVDVLQEHIDAAKIVRRDVDFLPVEAVSHILLTKNFGKLQ